MMTQQTVTQAVDRITAAREAQLRADKLKQEIKEKTETQHQANQNLAHKLRLENIIKQKLKNAENERWKNSSKSIYSQ